MWQWIENLNEIRRQAARLSDESASSTSSTLCQVPGGLSMIRDDTRRLSLAEVEWLRPRLGKRCKETGKKAVSLRTLFPMLSTSNFVLSEIVSHYWGRGRAWWQSKRGSWETHSKTYSSNQVRDDGSLDQKHFTDHSKFRPTLKVELLIFWNTGFQGKVDTFESQISGSGWENPSAWI